MVIYKDVINIAQNHTVDFVTILFSAIAIIISFISVIVAIYSWHKNRAIYDIEVENCYLGNAANKHKNNQLRDKMKSGKYAVLHVTENINGHTRVIIGKIRK